MGGSPIQGPVPPTPHVEVTRIELLDMRIAHLALSSLVGRTCQLQCWLDAAGVSEEAFEAAMEQRGISWAALDPATTLEVVDELRQAGSPAAAAGAGTTGALQRQPSRAPAVPAPQPAPRHR